MFGATERRIAKPEGQTPGQAIRFATVVLCLLGTACAYVGCIVVVVGGHIDLLFGLIPWLALIALGTILVVTVWALLGASHSRPKSRHRLAVARIRRLAARAESLGVAERALAKKQLIEHLDVARDALSEVVKLDPNARNGLLAAGVATRVERELDGRGGKWHRVSAAGVLGLLQSESSVTALTRALGDGDLDVAHAAAQALAQYTSPRAYTALLFALTKQRVPETRIAGLLEEFRCPAARELIERRADSEISRVRYWVAYLLGSLGDPRSAPVIEQLARDPEEDVRANAAEALASFPDPVLLGRLLQDESWIVRSHAAKAAGASGQASLAARLAGVLEDRSWWVRQNAMIALAGFGDAGVPHLLGQLRSEDRFARNKAAEALVRSGYANQQIELVRAGLPGCREAHRVLVEIGQAEALGAILSAVRATVAPEGRRRLLAVLQEIGTDEANSLVKDLGQPQAIDAERQLEQLAQLAQL